MYEFSFGAFFIGLIILILGAIGVIYHQKLADSLGSGVGSYERFRLWSLIACGLGIVIMLSLHSILLNWIVTSIFNR